MISSNTTTISNVVGGNIPPTFKTQTESKSNFIEDVVMTDCLNVDNPKSTTNAGLSTYNNKRANPSVVTITTYALIESVVKSMLPTATGSQNLLFKPEEDNPIVVYLKNECNSLKTTYSNGDRYSLNDLLIFVKRKKSAEFKKAKKQNGPRVYRTRPQTHMNTYSPRRSIMNQQTEQKSP